MSIGYNLRMSERIRKIGVKIKLERGKRNLSQEKLSELSGISKNFIGSIERGQAEPSITTLEQIAAALEMEFDDLINISKFEL